MGIINIFISTVLALIYPGAGQIYNGQTKKGFWFFGIAVTLWLLSETIFTRPWFEWIIRLFHMWAFIDAIVVAIGIYRGKRDLSFVRNWKGFMKIAVVIVVPLCLLLAKEALARYVLFNYIEQIGKPPEDPAKVQREIMEYLENKYGQEFEVVGEAEYSPMSGYFSLVVRPKENKRVTFAGYKHSNGKMNDTYLTSLWDVQFQDEIKPLIDEMYPPQNRWEMELDVAVSESLSEKIDPKNIPDYQEVREKYPDEMPVLIKMFLFKDMNESNKDEELEKVYRLIQFCREKGIKDYDIYIVYYEERLLKEKGRDIEVGLEYADYRTHNISVIAEEAETVRTPKDLEKYLFEFPK